MTLSHCNMQSWLGILLCALIFDKETAAFTHVDAAFSVPLNPCPPDSVMVDGFCRCEHALCETPSCEEHLNVVANASDVPGNCCATYFCGDCFEGATRTATGQCECVDERKSVKDDKCVCDLNKCPQHVACDEVSVAVKVQDDCCVQIACKKCPADSHPINYNDDAVEDKCVCFPCPRPECDPLQFLQIIRKGNNFPGACCDLYKCVKEPTCLINGTAYSDGEIFYNLEGSACKCRKGISLCDEAPDTTEPPLSCSYDGKIYPHLSTWAGDTCTNCTCYNGKYKCIAHICDLITSEVKIPDCPSVLGCNRTCKFGFKVKNGCELCKCKSMSYEFRYKLEKYMELHNLSEENVLLILRDNEHKKSVTSSTRFEPNTPIITHPECKKCHLSTTCYILTAVGFIFIVSFGLYLLCKRKPCPYTPIDKKPIDSFSKELHNLKPTV